MMDFRSAAFFALTLFAGIPAQAADTLTAKIDQCDRAVSAGDTAKALALSQEVLGQEANNRAALLCKGRAYGASGNHQEALVALQDAEQLSPTPLDQIVALTLMGNVQKSAGDFDAAMQTYQQSLALAKREANGQLQRININLIGEIQLATQHLDQALENFLAGSKLAANDNERADNYARIADVYNKQGKNDQAIEYQVKTMIMQEQSGDADSFAGATLELGRMYSDAKDYVNADKYFNKIIQLAKDQGGPYWEAMGYYYQAKSRVIQGQSAEARSLLTHARQISDQIGARHLNEEVKLVMESLPK